MNKAKKYLQEQIANPEFRYSYLEEKAKLEAATHETGKNAEPDMIERLLASPLEIKGFHPLKRDEIYI